jgi:hypothetical protein
MSRYVIDDSPSADRFVIDGPAITMPDEKTRLENAYKELASRNSFGQNFIDGGANAVQRVMLGYKQARGTATPADKQEFQAADNAFGGTVGGKVGDIVTTAAPAVAATMSPGLNTIVGQAAIGAGMGALMPADSTGERVLNTGLGGAIGGAAKYGGDKLANWLTGRATQAATQQAAANQTRDAAITASRQAGYTIPPSSANPTLLNRAAEGFAGKISTAQGAAIKNQPVTDALVRKSLGLADDAPLTRETLAGIRRQAGALYEPVKQLGTVTPDQTYLQAIDDLVAPLKSAAKDFPGVVADDVTKLADGMKVQQFDAGSAVDAIRALRESADANLGPLAKGSDKTLGRVQKELANVLEAQLERHATATGASDVVQALREARTLIAKSYSVEKALREGTGSVSANKLAQQLSKGKPLSGDLKTIATMGQNFPRAVQDITSSMPGVSPLDFGLGGGLAAVTGSPSMLALVAGRPMARSVILSPAYQRAMANAPNYGPGLLGRATPALLRSPAGQMGLTGGLLGEATQ